jgi:HTH-type transcriptional regulator / antitoxin HigA
MSRRAKTTVSTRSKSAGSAFGSLPASYLRLMAKFPLYPIKSGSQYERAASIVHRLAMREGKLDAGEEAYLGVLEALVENYDRRNNPIITDEVSPNQALRMLVEQAGMSVTELGRLLGSKGAASELLSGKRKEPSKSQIARLCARFKVDASVFMRPSRAPAHAA